MPDYTPPPASLDHLNAVQRYLQKGKLEFQDYVNILLVVAAYFILRPFIEAGMKRIFENKDVKEGEEVQKNYVDSKTKPKVGANEIRGSKTTAIGSSSGTTGAGIVPSNLPVNRKSELRDEVPAATAEQLLEWDDVVTTGSTEGGKTDVLSWMDRWG